MAVSPLQVPIPSIGELSQNAARLLQQSLAQAAQAADPAKLTAADLELARGNIQALAFVEGLGLHGAYRYLRDFIARQAIPIKSAGAFLDGWLETYKLPRKGAAAASGLAVAGTGVDDAVVAAGTLLQTSDGRQYKVTADATVSGGAVSVAVLALVAGVGGNLAASSTLQLVSPVNGIDATWTVGGDGISGGVDVEKDDAAVYRLQQRLSNEPRGGSPGDYARWAMSLPGITRAWGVRNPAGPTSAGVIIMADGNVAPGLPTESQRLMVRDYISDPRRGPPDELHVIIAAPVVHNYTIRLRPDTAANREATIAALQDLYFREPTPGGGMPHSHVSEVISGVVGEYNHTVLSPLLEPGGVFTAPTFDALLALGTVNFVT
ncbi:MAG: baseplate J/gp47 family protein [Pseudacidovorax sp.]|uniref:baseplate J/gp47 family protein n=1 Tax=Pseudacidovorax sp. TaxID=1934311 RepID=UPI001B5E07E0|nr:baseplate J/gp47 family protein [Pseudacidovorax sp.]MBP6897372.1 baseplate J/gp47 family protein [Pseudacidovorax sp.]